MNQRTPESEPVVVIRPPSRLSRRKLGGGRRKDRFICRGRPWRGAGAGDSEDSGWAPAGQAGDGGGVIIPHAGTGEPFVVETHRKRCEAGGLHPRYNDAIVAVRGIYNAVRKRLAELQLGRARRGEIEYLLGLCAMTWSGLVAPARQPEPASWTWKRSRHDGGIGGPVDLGRSWCVREWPKSAVAP